MALEHTPEALAAIVAASRQPVTEVHRLSAESYRQFEAAVQTTARVDSETSPIQAGYQLGVQEALRILRVGFVVG